MRLIIIIFFSIFSIIFCKGQKENQWRYYYEKAYTAESNKNYHSAQINYKLSIDYLLESYGLSDNTMQTYTYILFRRACSLLMTDSLAAEDSAYVCLNDIYNITENSKDSLMQVMRINCSAMLADIAMSKSEFHIAKELLESGKYLLLSHDKNFIDNKSKYYFYKNLTRLYNQYIVNLLNYDDSLKYNFFETKYTIVQYSNFYKEYIEAYEELAKLSYTFDTNNNIRIAKDLQLLAEHYRTPDNEYQAKGAYIKAFDLWRNVNHRNSAYLNLCNSFLSFCNRCNYSTEVSNIKSFIINEVDSLFMKDDSVKIIDLINYCAIRLEDRDLLQTQRIKYIDNFNKYFSKFDVYDILYYICEYNPRDTNIFTINNIKVVINYLSIISKYYYQQKKNDHGDLFLNKAIHLSLLLPSSESILLDNLNDAKAFSYLSIGDLESFTNYKSILITSKIARGEIPSYKDLISTLNNGEPQERINNIERFFKTSNSTYEEHLIEYYLYLGKAYTDIGEYHVSDSLLQIVDSLFHLPDTEIYNNEYTNHEYNEIYEKYKLYKAQNFIKKGRIDDAIELLKSSHVSIMEHESKEYLANLYKEKNDINSLATLLRSEYSSIREYITKEFTYLSTDERESFVNSPMIYWLGSVAKYAENNNSEEINSIAYDCALLTKGCNLSTTKFFHEFSKNISDENFKKKYNTFIDIDKKSIDVTDSLAFINRKYYLNPIEKDVLRNSNITSEHIDSIFCTYKDVQKVLSSEEMAVEFVSYSYEKDDDLQYAALVLTSNEPPIFIKLCKQKELRSLCSNSSRLYNKENSSNAYIKIWDPIIQRVPGKHTIYFSPCADLYFMNIEVILPDTIHAYRLSSTREVRNMVDSPDFTNVVLYGGINYDYNNKDKEELVHNNVAGTIIRSSLIEESRFGLRYLPHTLYEIENISKKLSVQKIKSSIYSGVLGSEESFKNLSGKNTSILHIATHGFYLNNELAKNNPIVGNRIMRKSGLFFSGAKMNWKKQKCGDSEDGILLSEEIEKLNLSNLNLVVLSACGTALGETSSEGVWGLQRAFKLAGAKTIIMSLWNVDDAATEIMMQSFYDHLLKYNSKHRAFRHAINEVKQKYPDPFYWASFIILD